MNKDLKSRIDHCYTLSENGATKLAQAGLQVYVKVFCDEPHKTNLGNVEAIISSMERASHRIGVDVALQYAEHFYQERDNKAARGWLHYGRWHAKKIGLNIGEKISEMKRKYQDRIPLIF